MHPPPENVATPGDVSMFAWEDYYWGYLFESRAASQAAVASNAWAGGYNYDTLERMERYSFAGYYYYKAHAPPEFANRTTMDNGTHYGTCYGLAKLPYVRDTRRSIGIANFLLNATALDGVAWPDTVGLALHGVDVWGHRMIPYSDLYPQCK